MSHAASPAESGPFSFELTEPPFELSLPPFEPTEISFALTRAERRARPRQVLRVQARICLDGDAPLEAHTVDLSSHGLAVSAERPLNVGQECSVELGVSMPEIATPPALRASVRYCARLHEGQFRIGMKFTAVSIEAAELLVAALEL